MTEMSRFAYRGRGFEFEVLEDLMGQVAGHDAADLSPVAQPLARLAVVSANPRRVQGLLDASVRRGMQIEQINPVFFLRRFEAFAAMDWACLLLCLDDCGGVGAVFDHLLRFRISAAATPVVLISSEFGQDDLSCERLPLGDVSLRAPLTEGRAALALERAVLNNSRWQERLQILSEDAAVTASTVTDQAPSGRVSGTKT
jgi:hypothetical protein